MCYLCPFELLQKKHHSLGGLNDRHVFFTVLEGGMSKIMAQADLVSGENPLNGSQTVSSCQDSTCMI